ncbi:Uncharacterized protein Fot_03662 [Forsythia ovata]|uniref:Uncharacterized protein n=1 Tax=Forsythia ovata TaxID=205694 RepID=A0ABD1XDD5_9LAMI
MEPPLLTNGVVIKELWYFSTSKLSMNEVVRKGKGGGRDTPKLPHSSSRSGNSDSPTSEKTILDGNADNPPKKKSEYSPSTAQPLEEFFRNRPNDLVDFLSAPLPGFISQACAFIFHSFNQAWESLSEIIRVF